jgi:uncharacterized protein YqeY
MTLQETIVADMRVALSKKEKKKLEVLRFVVGEFTHIPVSEMSPDRTLSDDKVIRIIKKCIDNELSVMPEADSVFIDTLKAYLPEQADYMEVYNWVKDCVDFSQLKSPAQAIGITKKHFGEAADSAMVREIVESLS